MTTTTHTKDEDGYAQDQFRPWDDWCACADCDPDQEHKLQYCEYCELSIELAENCDHDITGRTRKLLLDADDISGFTTLASGEVVPLSQIV